MSVVMTTFIKQGASFEGK